MTKLLLLLALVIGITSTSCAGGLSHPTGEVGFWNQVICAKAYGATGFTQLGPWNIGMITWKRNVADCD